MNSLYSLEAINLNLKSRLGIEIENEVKELRSSTSISKMQVERGNFAKIIKRNTGLSVRMVFSHHDYPSMRIPDLHKNNVVVDRVRSWWQSNADSKTMFEEKKVVEGTVNFRDHTVSGDFSKVVSELHIGQKVLWKSSSFSVKETTAMILHEIGHMFVYFEMIGRTTRTQYVLAEATKRLLDAPTVEERIVLLDEIENVYTADFADKQKLANAKPDETIYRSSIIGLDAIDAEHELGVNTYHAKAFEQLADQFVSRLGYGKPLATGLDRSERSHGYIGYMNSPTRILLYISKFSIFTLAHVGLITLGPLGWLTAFALDTSFIGHDSTRNSYDKPRMRLTKIKQDLISSLKDKNIDKETRMSLLSDIESIETLEDGVKEHVGAQEWVHTTLTPWGRKAKSMNKIQEDLESMVNNDLFAASSAFSIKA